VVQGQPCLMFSKPLADVTDGFPAL
jgi:hypothetical protein